MLQSCDCRAGAPRVRFLYYGRTTKTKLRFSSRSSGSTFPLLQSYYKVAMFEPEHREYVSFTTVVLQSCAFRAGAPGIRFLYYTVVLQTCNFRAGAQGVRFLYYGRTTKLRLLILSSGVRFLYYGRTRVQVFYYTVILQSTHTH